MEKAGSKTKSFPFLERTIEILIVDDEYSLVAANADLLNIYKLYNVTCAYSAKEADVLLSSSRRFHVCLFDLGMTDINNDECYLIKKYSSKVSFIVVSGRDSLEMGFKVGSCGALAAVRKPVDFDKTDIIDLINNAFFRNLLAIENLRKYKPIIKDAVEAFITLNPPSIKHWADKLGIKEYYLRKVWKACFNYQPRHIVWLCGIYSQAFQYYKFLYCERLGIKVGANDRPVDDSDVEYSNNRFKLMYKNHKKTILNILGRQILSV
ncbi:MAG: response regulator [Chitinispirillaceae bacterium]|jgi:FixJ family two-component response regulator